ncbi:unnamed protein product [marine sediment metagenome]|uniref:Uncharacterized protein n=1 Tax=marine sediment metagenome TaxID=412755 RepID=X1VR94_9ZZZZ
MTTERRAPATAKVQALIAAIKLSALANPDASIEFAKQQALQFVVENRTSDPSSPVDGQIWLRTDL